MGDDKQKILLALAGLGLILAVGYRLMHPYVQPRVAHLTHVGIQERAGRAVFPVTPPGPGPRAPALPGEKKASSYSHGVFDRFFNRPAYSGDLLNSLFAPPPGSSADQPPPPGTPPAGPARKNGGTDGAAAGDRAMDPVKKAVAYLTSFTVLGGYERGGEKAIFLSRNNQVLVARVGDRINGRYLITAMDADRVTIQALDINETIHLDTREFNDE